MSTQATVGALLNVAPRFRSRCPGRRDRRDVRKLLTETLTGLLFALVLAGMIAAAGWFVEFVFTHLIAWLA